MIWPFKKREFKEHEFKCRGVRPVEPIPPPPGLWEYTFDAGHCPRCGAPVYEIKEHCMDRTRHKEPYDIRYSCDCKARMDRPYSALGGPP